MPIEIIKTQITLERLKQLARENFGEMIKGVIDINKKALALGGELHADAEGLLLQKGSQQIDLWGINLYPARPKEERIEFSSFINIRPSQGNYAMEIQDSQLRSKIQKIIESLIDDNG